ncbi:succinate dehydrogenase subunit 4, mitochondrial-like isoform X2 [Phragmites australis]|uniref:succinate dehydrogenase subunit 4, mitochondrial-like isoform X2 n=1 Tax=Phragmites australis TaxID=29695 RepID=UPI002D797924|nr:succinate dehydrogenase subunit 4, mitochondrial-like isoform X2 [Phragmites australis]
MASRFLTRSKTLAHALSRADAIASPPLAGARWLRALSTLPGDPAAAAPSPRQPSVRSPLDLSKILGYERTSQLSGTQVLPRWFSTGASNGSSVQQEGASTKVTAFSPLEATVAKPRSSPLTSESLKVSRSELATKVSFYMIPTLLLVSRNSISTSLLVMSVFHQIYMFHKEIFLDYVHHDITRKWALIYFKILLLIMAKDTVVYFDLF